MAFSKLLKRLQFFSVNELTQFTEFPIWVRTYKTKQNPKKKKNKNKKETPKNKNKQLLYKNHKILRFVISQIVQYQEPQRFNMNNFFPFIKNLTSIKLEKNK